MAQKLLNGVHISGTTQLDFMPNHESEGIITLGRYDANTSRYHNIKSYVSSTLASNYLKFSLHNGTENTIVDVLTLKGDKSALFSGTITSPTVNSDVAAIGPWNLRDYADQTEYFVLDNGSLNGLAIKVRYDSATANRWWDLGFIDGNGTYYEGLKGYNNTTLSWKTHEIFHEGHKPTFAEIASPPTTISGYGITDALEIGTTSTTAMAGNTTIPGAVTDFVSKASGGTFLGDVTVDSTHFILKDGSPELYFHTEGNHYNWLAAVQENVDGGFEIGHSSATATALDQVAGNYTRALTLHPTTGATFAGTINAPDGSATTPAYNFTSHDGNGMYLEDYDAGNNLEQLSWATDGVRRAWVNEPGLWIANNLYFGGQLRKFGEWHATSGTSGQGFRFSNTADSTHVLTITSAGNADFLGSVKSPKILLADIGELKAVTTTSATATTVVAIVAHADHDAVFFDFVIKNGTNVRAGTVYACHNGASTPLVEFTETSTVDLGDTSDVTLSVAISGTNMFLQAVTTSSTWTIKSLIRAI
jgi:hypothetical protein